MIRAARSKKFQNHRRLICPEGRKIIAENFLQARFNAGMTQVELAESVGVTQQFVQGCERGTKHMSVDALFRFADALRIKPSLFLEKHGVPATRGVPPKDLRSTGRKHLQ